MRLVIWWPRRVLRLHDNPVLQQALSMGQSVLPLYIFQPQYLKQDTFRNRFLVEIVYGLEAALQAQGNCLQMAFGDPLAVFSAILERAEITQIVTEAEVTPEGKQMEQAVAQLAPLKRVQALSVFSADQVCKPDGTPYQVYGAYRKRWLSLPLPEQESLQGTGALCQDKPFDLLFPERPPQFEHLKAFEHRQAQQRLDDFLLNDAGSYGKLRDQIDLDATSHCSPFFRFGLLSPIHTVKAIQAQEQDERDEINKEGCRIWLNELIWREFFMHIMDGYADEADRLKNKDGSSIAWRESEVELQAWKDGRTGYPLVDAAMRQLAQTGWMPNRARMVVASFLVKDLFLWWRLGEQWFMQHLMDGDPAANHGNWQWSAGIGTDAAPYFRVFNPVTQSRKFDPQGTYIKTWVPELAQVPLPYLHEPWQLNLQDQLHFLCRIGKDYPEPIVEHGYARERALSLFNARKN